MNAGASKGQCIAVFGERGSDDQCCARPQRCAQQINELGRAIADQDLSRIHSVAARQSSFEVVSVWVGIARDRVVTLYESFARRSWRSERIDAGAEIENLAGFDTGVLCPALDIAAMGSID